MQTQAKVQLDERDGRGHGPQQHPLQAPGQQYMGQPPPGYGQGQVSMRMHVQTVGPSLHAYEACMPRCHCVGQ